MNLTIYQAGAQRLGTWLLLPPLLWILLLLMGGNFLLVTEYAVVAVVSAIAWEALRWVPDVCLIVRHAAVLAGVGAAIELILWLCGAPIAGNAGSDMIMLLAAPIVYWRAQPSIRLYL